MKFKKMLSIMLVMVMFASITLSSVSTTYAESTNEGK